VLKPHERQPITVSRFAMTGAVKPLAGGPVFNERRAHCSAQQKRRSQLLIVSEVAACVKILIGAGLLVRSFWGLTHPDLEFDPRNLPAAREKP
jgi:hypothetical protein